MSRILKCDPVKPEEELIEIVELALRKGGAVIIPTETQYGLALRADMDDVIEKICEIKMRDGGQKPALFVKDMDMASTFCKINEKALLLAEKFLPGPLTLVLPIKTGQDYIPMDFASSKGIGIRISSHPFLKKLTAQIDFPITATSANISGKTVPEDINSIMEMLGDKAAIYIDAGPIHGRIPSTVVCVDDEIQILRPGAIPEKEIFDALREVHN